MTIIQRGNKIVHIRQTATGTFFVTYSQECRTGIRDEVEIDVLASYSCTALASAQKWAAYQLACAP